MFELRLVLSFVVCTCWDFVVICFLFVCVLLSSGISFRCWVRHLLLVVIYGVIRRAERHKRGHQLTYPHQDDILEYS